MFKPTKQPKINIRYTVAIADSLEDLIGNELHFAARANFLAVMEIYIRDSCHLHLLCNTIAFA